MSNELHQFAARLNNAATALGGARMRQIMEHLGDAAQNDIEAAGRTDTHGTLRLQNVKGGERLGATVKTTSANQATVSASPGGPWSLLNSGARAHVVNGRRGGFLATPFGPRRSVRIPRTSGHHTWDDAVNDVTKRTTARAQAEVTDMLGEVIL